MSARSAGHDEHPAPLILNEVKNLIDLRASFTGSLDKLGMTLLPMGIDRGDPSGLALRMSERSG